MAITARDLVIWLADEFHDWIDGDDCVDSYERNGQSIVVRFESGPVFHIQVTEMDEGK